MKLIKKCLGVFLMASMIFMAASCDNGTEDPTDDVTTPTTNDSGTDSGSNAGGSEPEKKPAALEKLTFDYESAKEDYKDKPFEISWNIERYRDPVTDSGETEPVLLDDKTFSGTYTGTEDLTGSGITIKDGIIELNPTELSHDDDKNEYTFKGYYNGQIDSKAKGTVINLSGLYIENSAGPAILGEKDTEVSAKKGTVNYVIAKLTAIPEGTTDKQAKNLKASILCKKDLDIGGAGTCYVIGSLDHGIKGDDVEVKGSGKWIVQGTANGSAVNSLNFIIKEDKTPTLYALNSENGIKADSTISIKNGTVYICSTTTALKTDINPTDEKTGDPVEHSISLIGGTLYDYDNKTWQLTVDNGYTTSGATINKITTKPTL